ncbi:hypothetical protein [Spirillospora sp. NPDC047279]|uniref:hypothetical protein n=1 Tax=Spirillospora sp. NPDC047279 TaxID=3155478 RepID=UPI0033E79006
MSERPASRAAIANTENKAAARPANQNWELAMMHHEVTKALAAAHCPRTSTEISAEGG